MEKGVKCPVCGMTAYDGACMWCKEYTYDVKPEKPPAKKPRD